MKEHELSAPAGARTATKRLGRGIGSGHGKTAGRGTKGQKSRAGGNVARWFQGGQNPIHKKLPYKRGFTNLFRVEYNLVNLSQLDRFAADSEVTVERLFAERLVRRRQWPVKILGVGELSKPLTVTADRFSATARRKIEAAGGRVVELAPAATAEAE